MSRSHPCSPSRRDVLRGAALLAAAATVTVVPRHVLGGPRHVAPSDKLNVAGVGVGGMGAANLRALESENIVALCDVDPTYAAGTVARYPKARFHTDFRKMLGGQKDIDAVVIATPDHTHAVIALSSLRAGKHVYCQKPLTHTVHEARVLARAARETRLATQMGIQGHSMEGLRLVREWVQAGVIGPVREVDAWCSLSYYPWGHAGWSSSWSERPKEAMRPPANLAWDLWLGPAPARAYHRAYHPATWRCWWDFGCGMMGDRGAHTFDPVYSALKLTAPTTVDATSCGTTAEVHPLSAIVTFQFPARGEQPPVKLTWYEGTRPPRPDAMPDASPWPAEGGALLKGTRGMILCGVYGNDPVLLPESLRREAGLPPKTLPRVAGSHEQDWVRACKGGPPAGADFAYSGPLTEACLLGNVAKRVDGRIVWDAEQCRVTNRPEANAFVRREARPGWSLE